MHRFVFFWLFIFPLFSVPQYYCTAATADYFQRLLGLIGSIHASNYDDLKEIAVFDLGLTQQQLDLLSKIDKTRVHVFKDKNPDLFRLPVHQGHVGKIGAYAWKPVAIQEALDEFPYVLWIDAGALVLKSLNPLFEHITAHGYFVCTIGDETPPRFPIGWSVTASLREKFQLDRPENQWLLSQEQVMGGVIGASRFSEASFLRDLSEMTQEIRYFIDDGTTSGGYGTGRHDQVILSLLAYGQRRKVFQQDYTQKQPMILSGKAFYITWNKQFVNQSTCIFNSRNDPIYTQFFPFIHWRR